MSYHLAQANIARMHGHPGEPVMAGLVARIDEMNGLAEESPGFVWRLRGAEATADALRPFDKYFLPFEPNRIFYNMSVWESIEHLRHYTYKTGHREMVRSRQEWITAFDRPHLVMWWIPVGHRPTIAESVERFQMLQE